VRILLVQAFTAADMELVYPLGLASLAAQLEGHEVEIVDLNLYRERPFDALKEAVHRLGPDVVGFSLRNMKVGMPHLHTDDFDPQKEALETLRSVAPGIPVIGGGTAFSLYAEAMMRRLPGLSLGVWGEAEERLPRLLEQLDRPWEVPGVWFRRDGRPVWSGESLPVDFAAIRPPRRDLVPLAPYAKSSFVSVGVQAKRGCALRCVHCADTFLSGRRIRMRDPVRVVDEVEALVREHGIRQLTFCDQQFNIPPGHALDICREIVRRRLDVRWSAWFNVHRAALPEELLVWLQRAGCRLLSFSPDHVDDRMLRGLDKNFRASDLDRTVDLARRHDVDVEYSFFLNAPGEDLRSLAEILVFLGRARLRLGPRLRLFTLLLLQPIRIYPHTPIHDLALRNGLVDPAEDLIEGRFYNPRPLDRAVAVIQRGARVLYDGRERLRAARGESFGSL
jgi:anaerobic magnesium-protoporphyrin IX monomethyl ester cyclase